MVLVNVDDGIVWGTSALQRQETGRIDLAGVAGEHHAFPVPDSQRCAMRTALAAAVCSPRTCQRVALPFQDVAAVVRRFGRLDAKRLTPRMMPQALERNFVLLGRDARFLDAAADRNQEEDGPHRNLLRREQCRHVVDLMEVAGGDTGVDLDGHVQLPGAMEHPQRPLEAALPATEGVVGFRVGAVEADSQAADAGVPRGLEGFRGCQRGRGRRQGHLQPFRDGVPDQREQVGPFQRIAAGQHQDRRPGERGHLVDQGQGLLGGKFAGVRVLLSRCPAMVTHQIARLGDLVVEHQRIAGEVGLRVFRMVHGYFRFQISDLIAVLGRVMNSLSR